jgi:DNA-binding transcriptional LysR family regulator
MTLEQIRIFIAVAEREHMTEAARALPLAQSAVSSAIATLEQRYEVKLFDRIGRRVALTDAGRALLVRARAILAEVAEAEHTLGEFGAATRGSLALHASQTVASYWLPRHLAAFRIAHPGIALKLNVGNSSEVAESVLAGAADLGFVEDDVERERLESETLALDQMLLVVAPGHPWAEAAPTPQDLAQGQWVLREPGSGTRAAVERTLAAQRLRLDALNVALELPTNESVRAAVEAGLGATALSASVAAASLEAGLLRPVAFPMPPRAFRLLRRASRHRIRIGDALIAAIRGQIGPAPALGPR